MGKVNAGRTAATYVNPFRYARPKNDSRVERRFQSNEEPIHTNRDAIGAGTLFAILCFSK
jgi:hypothetical protein